MEQHNNNKFDRQCSKKINDDSDLKNEEEVDTAENDSFKINSYI